MSAKHGKKHGQKPAPSPNPEPAIAAATMGAATAGGSSAAAAAAPADQVAWIDSSDPKKRMWGKIILIGVWIYVAALWLLALDQTFNWGIFGPKMPPIP